MIANHKRLALIAAGAAALAIGASACSSVQPSLGEYAIVTGHGALSSTQVQKVVSPGVTFNTGNGTTDWFFPANARNFVTGPGGDRALPQAELTADCAKGKTCAKDSSGMSDYVFTYVAFEVNPEILVNKKFASKFLTFCLKYACASTKPQNDTSNANNAHSSTPGWNTMLDEIFPRAIDLATQTAIQNYGPDLWNNRGVWTQLGTDISNAMPAEMQRMTGSGEPYFCGLGATTSKCPPPFVQVNPVVPADKGVQAAYNQEQTALYAKTANEAQIAAARVKYGSEASFWLGLQDSEGACPKQATCNFYIGNIPGSPGSK